MLTMTMTSLAAPPASAALAAELVEDLAADWAEEIAAEAEAELAEANTAILLYLAQTTERRGHVERLPGLPGAKRVDEEVMLVGFPF